MTNNDETILEASDHGISDYLLESMADELRRLKLEIIQLRSELEIAKAKASFYEDEAGSIQEVVKGALRSAFEIKQNADKQAQEITNQAHEEKRRLQEEIEALVGERDRVREEIAELRSSLSSTQQQRNALHSEKEQLRNDLDALEQRLRSIRAAFDEVETIPSSTPAMSPAISEDVDKPAVDIQESIGNEQETVVLADSNEPIQDEISPVTDNEPIQDETSPVVSNESIPDEIPPAVDNEADQDEMPPTVINTNGPSDVQQLEPQESGTNGSATVENVPAARRRINLADFLATKPGNDIELVVSSLHGFPKLVEFERALHEFAEIKNFYVRDFRNGIARLVVRLKDPSQRRELQNRLESLPGWNISVTASEPSKIEMKVIG